MDSVADAVLMVKKNLGDLSETDPVSYTHLKEEPEGEEEKELGMEAVMFSRKAVTNSLMSKLIPKPEKKTDVYKRQDVSDSSTYGRGLGEIQFF